MPHRLHVIFAIAAAFAAAPVSPALGAADPVSFRNDVAPILLAHCQACHGPKESKGGYRLDSYQRALKAGKGGDPGFKPKAPAESEVFLRVTSDDKAERMPKKAEPLSAPQIALIRRWIEQGARFDGDDPAAPLTAIVPHIKHPDPPHAYTHTLPITAMAFSPDGSELFVGGYHELTVWNPADGKLLRRIPGFAQRTYALAFSPDGNLLAVAGGDPGQLGEVRLIHPATGELVKVLDTRAAVVFDTAFNPKGDRLAAAGADAIIHVFDLSADKPPLVIESHSDWIMAIAWSPDGARLASASRDKTAKVFDAAAGDLLNTYTEHNDQVNGVLFAPQGDKVYSSGNDKRIHLWKIADAKRDELITGFSGQVFKLTAAGASFAAPCSDGKVRQYDSATHKLLREYSGHDDWVLSAAIHPKTQRIAGGGFDGTVRIWNTEDGKLIATFLAAPGLTAD